MISPSQSLARPLASSLTSIHTSAFCSRERSKDSSTGSDAPFLLLEVASACMRVITLAWFCWFTRMQDKAVSWSVDVRTKPKFVHAESEYLPLLREK